MKLANADSEEEVISILRSQTIGIIRKIGRLYGDIENNFSVIGNQQSLPESAIVEKLINSVDAVLMRECLRRRIDPESSEAPRKYN